MNETDFCRERVRERERETERIVLYVTSWSGDVVECTKASRILFYSTLMYIQHEIVYMLHQSASALSLTVSYYDTFIIIARTSGCVRPIPWYSVIYANTNITESGDDDSMQCYCVEKKSISSSIECVPERIGGDGLACSLRTWCCVCRANRRSTRHVNVCEHTRDTEC